MNKTIQVGQLFGTTVEQNPSGGRVYSVKGVCPTLGAGHGMSQPYIENPKICAMRGRNPDNPKSRKSGEPTEQMIEMGPESMSNTLTTVQKDNLVIQTNLRVRKLTPLECWRLMDFDDEDFKKAEAAGISQTQLYKQAGNSIAVGVLEAIFRGIL